MSTVACVEVDRIERLMRATTDNDIRTWLILPGLAGAVFTIAVLSVLIVNAMLASGTANETTLYIATQRVLHVSFLLISLGVIWQLRTPATGRWKWAVRAAMATLACGIVGQITSIAIAAGWVTELTAGLGAIDSLERRLFRLGAMAAFAIPMMTLLAAAERKQNIEKAQVRLSARIAALLVRWEPVLFMIGAVALPGILLAAAFLNKEFTWLAPIGADTSFLACAAAAIRARWRADDLAFAGWLLVCISMSIGLVMGIYAFGGPIPAPEFIGDYNALPRSLLRNGHVVLLLTGVACIALSAAGTNNRGAS